MEFPDVSDHGHWVGCGPAFIAAWAPRKTWVRVALAITLLIMPIGFLQVTEMLSRPKPANYGGCAAMSIKSRC